MTDVTRPPSTRLFAILARKAPVAVIFRRGPSKRVKLIKWDTQYDTFEHGQWLKGRIYERRCDLSPSGQKLIYFAANYKPPYFSWTAVSRPPYLTALALWPKGDAWGGGGHFKNEKTILLNHGVGNLALAEGFRLAGRMRVSLLGEYSGRGEDDPVYHERLLRDGWKLVQPGKHHQHELGSELWWEFDPPQIYARKHRYEAGHTSELRMVLRGLHERDGDWYVLEYEVTSQATQEPISLGRLDWADWDKNGDLLFAKEGRLYRMKPDAQRAVDETPFAMASAAELADFRDLAFEEVNAPEEALHW